MLYFSQVRNNITITTIKVQKCKGRENFIYEEMHMYVRGEEGGRTSRRTV